ncbi:MAG TPA: hypothetical protein VFX10_00445 [Nitrospira sp.]|nr:hypothetical protein [Nitrospira sp.]
MLKKSASGVLAGHCRLTDSPARTDVALFIHRAVRLIPLRVADLPAALFGALRVLARRGWAGEIGKGASRRDRGGRVRMTAFLTTLRPF